jgi:hypothetical protein
MPMNPRLLVPRATFDPDAAAYLRAVEAADGQALETPVKRAVDDFFRGTKADGTFSALKAACILCGARTLAGALVPLAGDAPTNYNFVDADYNRETGLVGNGSTKYLDSGRNNADDPQNNFHQAVYVSSFSAGTQAFIGAGGGGQSGATCFGTTTSFFHSNRDGVADTTNFTSVQGLIGQSRTASASYAFRANGSTESFNRASQPALNGAVLVHARNVSDAPQLPSASRLAFYSIGESISDLALLDTRVTALVTAIGAAL